MEEEFLKLKWRIQGPHELDYGPYFIPDDEIRKSYVFNRIRTQVNKAVNSQSARKVQNKANVIPIQSYPGCNYRYNCEIKSFMTFQEHSKCLRALQIVQSGRKNLSLFDKGCIELYSNAQQKIADENVKFLDFAKKRFFKATHYPKITSDAKHFSDQVFCKDFDRCKDYQQFYKRIDMLSYSYREDEIPIQMLFLTNILDLGTVAKFSKPTLVKPYNISLNKLPNVVEKFNSNLPVSKDVNVKTLLEQVETDVVISSGGLKRLLNYTETNAEWDIPVTIEEVQFKLADGIVKTKNVVFIDKPLPNKCPTSVEITERCVKKALKVHFCSNEAFKYSNVEKLLHSEAIKKYKKRKINKNKTCNVLKTDELKLNISQRKRSSEVSVIPEPKKLKMETKEFGSILKSESEDTHVEKLMIIDDALKRDSDNETSKETNSRLDEVPENINNGFKATKKEKQAIDDSATNQPPIKSHHNVSYRLWSLKSGGDQNKLMKSNYNTKDIKVMVRCKIDGCEMVSNTNMLQPISLYAKLEYQPEFGGTICSKSELVKQWASLYFTPHSQLYRVRTVGRSKEALLVEQCNIQKICNEAQTHYQYKPSLGFGVLYKLFLELTKLPKGEYLLHHVPKDGAFISLLQGTTNADESYDLYEEYSKAKWRIKEPTKMWIPIDIKLILPKHLNTEHMPGLFPPCRKVIAPSKKSWKGKRKNKKKKQKVNAK